MSLRPGAKACLAEVAEWFQAHPDATVRAREGGRWIEHWVDDHQLDCYSSPEEQEDMLKALGELVVRGLDLSAPGPRYGLHPLVWAVQTYQVSDERDCGAVLCLLDAGSNPWASAGKTRGETAMSWIEQMGDEDVTAWLEDPENLERGRARREVLHLTRTLNQAPVPKTPRPRL